MEHYSVRISKDQLVFSAAHFITLEGEVCERLHGHNYRVGAEVHGPLNEQHYVVDFLALRDALQEILEELDHYVLLPTGNPGIEVTAHEREVEVRFAERRWVFPRDDCRLLPVPNTTAELLGRYIAGRLLEALERRCGSRPTLLRIEVDECFGQSAICELRGA
jgi:6-pyruvoyltetrahydropterin/6-carboxytetrahydropterin synthase